MRLHLLLPTLLLALTTTAAPTPAQAQDAPRERTEKLLSTFREIQPGKNLPAPVAAANAKVIDRLDAAFDFEGITDAILAPRADKLLPADRARFKAEFHALIRAGTFVDTSAFFKKATLTFNPSATVAGASTVAIHVAVPAEDNELDVGLVWRDVTPAAAVALAGPAPKSPPAPPAPAIPPTPKIVDILVDGDSLVKDYQNQVAGIVDREGAAGLFAKLAERRAQIDRAQVK